MTVDRKLVSVFLVLFIPTLSAISLSACPQQMPEMSNPHSHMAITGMTLPEPSFVPSQSSACCELSPAEIAPGLVQASVSNELFSILTRVDAAVQITDGKKRNGIYSELRSASPPARAVLCVFLI
jgi:hypothetical protein